MKYTHYIHDKYLSECFTIRTNDYQKYKEYIKQIQYHRDDIWINLLIEKGLSINEVKTLLELVAIKTCDWDMNTKIIEVNK